MMKKNGNKAQHQTDKCLPKENFKPKWQPEVSQRRKQARTSSALRLLTRLDTKN